MKPQPHLTRLALTLAGIALIALHHVASANEPAATDAPGETIVYYFHRTARCHTCLSMETWTSQAIAKVNSAETSPKLAWRAVNLDEPENAHFADDFQLSFGTVVVAEYRDGQPVRWKNLEKVWEFSADETTFSQYLESEFGPFFGGGR